MHQSIAIPHLLFYQMEAAVPMEAEKKKRKKKSKGVSLVHYTRKSVGVIHISNDLSINARKAANWLIKNAQDVEREMNNYGKADKFFTDTNGNTYYKTNFEDIENLLGLEKYVHRQYIRDILHSLTSTALRYNILNRDNTNKRGWEELMSLLPYAKYKLNDNDPDSTIYYDFPHMIKDVIINPSLYAPIDLNMQKEIKGKGALALLEYFSSELAINQTDELTTEPIKMENFVLLVGGSKVEYDKFKYINQELIKKPLEEINEKSTLTASPITHKKGRKVEAISYHIKRKEGYDTPLLDVNVNPMLKVVSDKEEPETENSNDILVLHGVSEAKRKSILSKYSSEHIKANVSAALKWLKQRDDIPKANIPPTIVKAITGNWANYGTEKVEIEEKNALLSRLSVLLNTKVNQKANVKQSSENLGDALFIVKKAEKITAIYWLDVYYDDVRQKFGTLEAFCEHLKGDFQEKVKEARGILLDLKQKYGLTLLDVLKKWGLKREDLFSNMLTTEDEFVSKAGGLVLDN